MLRIFCAILLSGVAAPGLGRCAQVVRTPRLVPGLGTSYSIVTPLHAINSLLPIAVLPPSAWAAPAPLPRADVEARPALVSGQGCGGLIPGSWLPKNRERLERLIRKYGRGGAEWDPEHPPLATFDWDNTMIRNDIGEAVLYYALREMRLKYDLGDTFWNLVPEELGRDAWRASYEAVKNLPPGDVKQTPEYRRYLKLALSIYERAKKDRSLKLDMSWRTRLMIGFAVPELERLTDEAIDYELSRPLGEEYIREYDADPAPVKIKTGLRPHREMFDLAAALQAAGWEVRVVSASTEWMVARFAARAGIPREHVHGTLARVADGRLTGEVVQKTWGQGKADAILKHAGRPSLLAAGDSNIDREMLSLSQGEKLVINFGREPLRSLARLQGWMLQPPFDMRRSFR